ncbi:MAG: BACON domain-containing protein [Bacteroidales bacterium]
MDSKQFILIVISLLFLHTGCNDNAGDIKQGLTVIDNICFSTDGGDVSNTLLANDSWSITLPGDNLWLSVSPGSGQGSANPINLIFNAQVNNNTGSRSQQVILRIGDKTFQYTANQDGTLNQVCNF